MSKQAFLEALQNMKGKTFTYANKVHYIKDFKINDRHGRATIVTNLQEFERPYEAMDDFLSYWQPCTQMMVVDRNGETEEMILQEQTTSIFDNLTRILQDNIAKIKEDSKFIPQAQQMNSDINAILQIQKLKLTAIKEMRKMKGAGLLLKKENGKGEIPLSKVG